MGPTYYWYGTTRKGTRRRHGREREDGAWGVLFTCRGPRNHRKGPLRRPFRRLVPPLSASQYFDLGRAHAYARGDIPPALRTARSTRACRRLPRPSPLPVLTPSTPLHPPLHPSAPPPLHPSPSTTEAPDWLSEAISLYSSPDLTNWKFEGRILEGAQIQADGFHAPWRIERPKVSVWRERQRERGGGSGHARAHAPRPRPPIARPSPYPLSLPLSCLASLPSSRRSPHSLTAHTPAILPSSSPCRSCTTRPTTITSSCSTWTRLLSP